MRAHPNEELVRGVFRALREGDRATVEASITEDVAWRFPGQGKCEGRRLDNPNCLRIRIRDGRISELREFVWDLYEVGAFWN